MNTRIPCLEILFMAFLFYPSGVSQIISMMKRDKKDNLPLHYLITATLYLIFALALTAIYLPYYNKLSLSVDLKGVLLGLAVAMLVIPAEYCIGVISLKLQGRRVERGIKLNKSWQRQGAALWIITIIYAVVEEILYRGVWKFILIDRIAAPWIVFFVCSAILYGLNHLRFGGVAIIQKTFTGACFTAIYLLSGYELLVPIIAHVGQNLLLFALERKGSRE